MGRPTFFRVALLLPLVVPLLSLALMRVFDDQLTSGPLLGFAVIIAGAALYYTVPYLLVATYLFIRLPRWTLGQQRSALWIAPLVVTVLSAIGAAIWDAAAGSGGWWSNVGTAFAFGLPCGFAYAGIIAIVEYVTRPVDAATASGGMANPP